MYFLEFFVASRKLNYPAVYSSKKAPKTLKNLCALCCRLAWYFYVFVCPGNKVLQGSLRATVENALKMLKKIIQGQSLG